MSSDNQHQQTQYDTSNVRQPPPQPPPHASPSLGPFPSNPHSVGSNAYVPPASSNYNANPYPISHERRSSTPLSQSQMGYYPNDSSVSLGPTPADDDYGGEKGSKYRKSSSWSTSEQNLVHSDSDDDEKPLRPKSLKRKKRTCFDYLCCVCFPCCPKWLRWVCCCSLLIFVALGATIGVLAALFKMPTISLKGVQPGYGDLPQFSVNGTSWTLNFALNIEVVNPNIESVTFSEVKAVAYYPTTRNISPRPSVGGGRLPNVHIASQATTNITFPFSINYDPNTDVNQAILQDIASKCGLLGGSKVPLTVDYDLMLSVKVVFFTVTPIIYQHATMDCPIQNGQLPQLPGTIPSAVKSLLPSQT